MPILDRALVALAPAAQAAGDSAAAFDWRNIATIDWIGLALVGVLVLMGLVRGLWWQVIRLVGLAGAVLLARSFTPRWQPRLLEQFPDLSPRFAQGLLWLILFLAGIAAAALIGMLGKRMLAALQLSLVDRIGGALAGAATGVVVHAVLLAVLVQLAPEDFAVGTVQGTWSERLLETVSHRIPVLVNEESGGELARLLDWTR